MKFVYVFDHQIMYFVFSNEISLILGLIYKKKKNYLDLEKIDECVGYVFCNFLDQKMYSVKGP